MGLRLKPYPPSLSPMYLYQIGEAGLAVVVHDNLALVCSVLWAWRFRSSRHVHVYGLLALHSCDCLLLSIWLFPSLLG